MIRDSEVEKELHQAYGNCCAFVRCDIRSWEDQKAMFETAKTRSSAHSVDVVLASVDRPELWDSLWVLDGKCMSMRVEPRCQAAHALAADPNGEATKPALNIINTNLNGSLYTFKLAVHYFRKQPDTDERDRCFITGSLNGGWIDSPVSFARATQVGVRPELMIFGRETGSTQQPSMHSMASLA